MRPLPKYLGYLAILAAVLGALNSADVIQVVGPKIGAFITTLATIVAALSHSLTGSGGQPPVE